MNKTTKTLAPLLVLIAGIAIVAFGVWNNMQTGKDASNTANSGATISYADPASGLSFSYPTAITLTEITPPTGFSIDMPHTADPSLPTIMRQIGFANTDSNIILMQKTKTTELDAWLKTMYPDKTFVPTDPFNGTQAYQLTTYYDEFGQRTLTRAPQTANYLVGRYTFLARGPWIAAFVEYWNENTSDADQMNISNNAEKLYTAFTTSAMLAGADA